MGDNIVEIAGIKLKLRAELDLDTIEAEKKIDALIAKIAQMKQEFSNIVSGGEKSIPATAEVKGIEVKREEPKEKPKTAKERAIDKMSAGMDGMSPLTVNDSV